MTEEKPKSKPRARRSDAEIEADLERRLARKRWAGVRDALGMLDKASNLMEEASAACGDRITTELAEKLGGVIGDLGSIVIAIQGEMPPEAR